MPRPRLLKCHFPGLVFTLIESSLVVTWKSEVNVAYTRPKWDKTRCHESIYKAGRPSLCFEPSNLEASKTSK